MTGGSYDKRGNWYEEDWVIWHLILIADEQESSLVWEGEGLDNKGVDCWIQREDTRIAFQFKTHSTGAWSIADLARSKRLANGADGDSVLSFAALQLQRTDGGAPQRFEFVTDSSAPHLNAALAAARSDENPEQWLHGNAKEHAERVRLVRGLGFDPNDGSQLRLAYSLIKRMSLTVQSHQAVRAMVQSLLSAITQAPEEVRERLRSLAHASMGRTVTTEIVRQHLSCTALRIPWDQPERIGTALIDAAQFAEASGAAARRFPVVHRSEAIAAYQVAVDPARARTVVVQGAAGSGKSEVLLQVLTALRANQVPTLFLRADQADKPPLDHPVRSLSRYAAGARACLIIDQLDQVILAGERAQHLLTPMAQWIRQAQEFNVAILVGCRSIDVDHDVHLRSILKPDDPDRCRTITVGDFSEQETTRLLTHAGIPFSAVHPDLLPLIRRPLVLHLLSDLVAGGGAVSGVRTILDLILHWWALVGEPLGTAAADILTTFANAVEDDGQLAVDRAFLQPATVVQRLIDAGVLVAQDSTRLRPFHQAIVDVWLARRWGGIASAEELLKRIGTRDRQDLHQARRLRMATPLLASRDRAGTQIFDVLLRHPDIRPMLKRAVLLGIGALDAPSPSLIGLVRCWLEDPSLRNPVRDIVVYNRIPWMDALDDWITGAWQRSDKAGQQQLMRLLAAVSKTRGDAVARHLKAWSEHDATVLKRAHWTFWHDPSQDSDELFEMRLRYLAETQQDGHHLRWETVLAQNAQRALRLLAYQIGRSSDEALLSRPPDWMHGWPSILPETMKNLGLASWRLFKERWCHIVVHDPEDIHVSMAQLGDGQPIIECLIEILSAVFAGAISTSALTWIALLSELPEQKRFIDGWLLLRTGAKLDMRKIDNTVAREAVQWFMGDRSWARIGPGRFPSCNLAEQFLGQLCPLVDDITHAALEQWLVDYPQLPIDDAQDQSEESGECHRQMYVAYRLLHSTDQSRWSAATQRVFSLLLRRFGPIVPYDEDHHGWAGLVRSDIDDARAMAMSCEEWVVALRRAAKMDHRSWKRGPDGSFLSGDLSTYIAQLQHVVPYHPRRFYDGIELFLAIDADLSPQLLPRIIGGMIRKRPPDRLQSPGTWEPLDDAEVEALFSHPAIRGDSRFSGDLSDAVLERPALSSSDAFIEWLIATARDDAEPGVQRQDDEELLLYRLNERSCRSIDALCVVADARSEWRERLFVLADCLATHEDPGRRAAAALLAVHAQRTSPQHGFAVLLAVANDPLVAAERDIAQCLCRIAGDEQAAPMQQQRAREILLGLVPLSGHQCRQGGRCAMVMRAWGSITPERMSESLQSSPEARRAAADVLAGWLADPLAPAWIYDQAVIYANDNVSEIGDLMLHAFNRKAEHLLRNTTFMSSMATSAAARRNPSEILEVCAASPNVLAAAPAVLEIAQVILDDRISTDDHWRLESIIEACARAIQSLASEAEQRGDDILRVLSLNVWDALIEKELAAPTQRLDYATEYGIGRP